MSVSVRDDGVSEDDGTNPMDGWRPLRVVPEPTVSLGSLDELATESLNGTRVVSALDPIVLDAEGFEVLTEDQCRSLLARVSFGRVATSVGALPVIFPVNYCLVGDNVVFGTGEGWELTTALNGTVVAFEADSVNERLREIWSVQLTGRAEVVAPRANPDLGALVASRCWVPFKHKYLVTITPVRMTGRRL